MSPDLRWWLLKALFCHDVYRSFDNPWTASEVILLSATPSILISFIVPLSVWIRLWSLVLYLVCNHFGIGHNFVRCLHSASDNICC